MGRSHPSHPSALRERVVAFVEEGHGHREAARHFRVSPRFVNNLVILKRETGSLSPRRQGHVGGGKRSAHHDWVRDRMTRDGERRWMSSASNSPAVGSWLIVPASADFFIGSD